jgi:hypothetical protein
MDLNQIKRELGDREWRLYALIEKAASEGRRCPTNAEIATHFRQTGVAKHATPSGIPRLINQLIRRGLITVRIYGNNWRDVIILQGRHAGMTTSPPPHGGKPHLIIDPSERERRDKAER